MNLRVFNSAGEEVAWPVREQPAWLQPSALKALIGVFSPDGGGQALLEAVGAGLQLAWDGRNSGGQPAGSGAYTLVLAQTDRFGATVTFSAAVQLLRAAASAEIEIFNSAGERVRRLDPPGDASRLDLDQSGFVPSDLGGQDLKIGYGEGLWMGWDGRNDRGELVNSGSYLVLVRGTQGGQSLSLSREVVLLKGPGQDPLAGALVAPNPLGPAQTELRILLPGLASTAPLRARIYSLSGELVAEPSGRAPDGSLRWAVEREGAAAGIYVIELNAQNAEGRRHRRTLKAAVLR